MNNKSKKIKSLDKIKICNMCNPQKYLKFNFSFLKENGLPRGNDVQKLFERLKFLSSDMYLVMLYKYQGDKRKFIEEIPINDLKILKEIPTEFRKFHPAETNEKFSIFRIYPAGSPPGSANPRIIGMIKNTIFYVFYIDWTGNLYEH